MNKLAVGRIVLYRVGANDNSELRNNNAKILPAIVISVWNSTCANLKVFSDSHYDIWKTSICEGDGEYQWSWPKREE